MWHLAFDVKLFTEVFVTLVVIMDPVGTIPLFLALTAASLTAVAARPAPRSTILQQPVQPGAPADLVVGGLEQVQVRVRVVLDLPRDARHVASADPHLDARVDR